MKLPGWLRVLSGSFFFSPGNSEYVQAELVGLACLAHNRSPPVDRYLLTRFGNEWLFELHFRVTN